MNRTYCAIVFAGILASALLTSCGVRDPSEDGTFSSVDGGNALGSDTSAIAGFWNPPFGGRFYVVVSEVGHWSYVREHDVDNCFEVETHDITLLNKEENLYTIDEAGNVYSMIAFVTVDGELSIEVLVESGESATFATYEPITSFMPEDLQECGIL